MTKDFFPVCLFSREGIKYMPILDKKYKTNRAKGLCNQLFALINGINKAKRNNKKFVVIDSFLRCIVRSKICPISSIFDLDEMSKSFGIKILDRMCLNITINSILYGIDDSIIDITDKFRQIFDNDQKIIIKKTVNLNKTFGDPCFRRKKKIFIKYSINNTPYELSIDEYRGYLLTDINFDVNYIKCEMWNNSITSFCWYNPEKIQEYINDLKKIKFHNNFYKIINILKPHVKNCIHLRLEPDAINYWSKVNKLSNSNFYNQLSDKYYNLISNNVSDKSEIYLLIHEYNHSIIEKLKQKYNIKNITFDKSELIYSYIKYSGREISAIIDLLIGSLCNNVFIGCHSLKYNRGSTFSFILLALMNNKKNILIDIDNISNIEEIHCVNEVISTS